ncbi:CHAT domain-containing protein [Mycena vulgaris]|nr:CHAT domain-containing protein [Mycena vulgaris]
MLFLTTQREKYDIYFRTFTLWFADDAQRTENSAATENLVRVDDVSRLGETEEDIDRAVRLYREAHALSPAPHPDQATSLINLANSLRERFEQRGDATDLDEAIQLHRHALALYPASHPGRASSLNNLATSINMRFELRGDAMDLDQAIWLYHEVLALRLAPHPDRVSTLTNLAVSLYRRFELRGGVEDIDQTIQLYREALALRSAPHPGRAASLGNLANSLRERFEQTGDAKDLDEAIQLHRDALALRPASHPGRASSLNNLAASVNMRFKLRGHAEDMDEAIRLYREVLALHLAPYPDRARALNNLATCLVSSGSLTTAIPLFQEASVDLSASPLARFQAAKQWATTAYQNRHSSALEAYQITFGLLVQLTAFSLDLQSRQAILRSHDIASNAAACAIDLGQYEMAIEFLEAGRSILWSQSMHLRTPIDDLRTVHPALATKLAELSRKLEQSSFRDTSRNLQSDSHRNVMSMEAEGVKCRQLNDEWIQTVESVRLLPGFEDFMRPKGISPLRLAAARGPVVVLNAGDSSCHALIVDWSGQVNCVPLPVILTRNYVKRLADIVHAISSPTTTFDSFLATLSDRGFGSNPTDRLIEKLVHEKNQSPTDWFRCILGILWSGIVAPVIRSLNLQKTHNPPRLWWCPTGPFTFLPIHAAGIYDEDSIHESVADYVISSFTPTLTALLSTPHPPFGPGNPLRATAVIQPNTPGCSPLPYARDELRKIKGRIPAAWLTSLHSPVSVDAVLHHLQTSSILHFACHGVQDTGKPLQSAFLMDSGRLTVSQIMKSSGATNSGTETTPGKDMRLAFLSACQTAMGDRGLPDEAMHLAPTLLFAGFCSVVATMWTTQDSDGPKIADAFYEHLFRNVDPGSSPPVFPDLNESAEALHFAVAKLRTQVPLLRWIPFVHYGL